MKIVFILIKRNVKLFFKDKGMFFTSLITPAILLVLYAAFLGNIYRDNFTQTRILSHFCRYFLSLGIINISKGNGPHRKAAAPILPLCLCA